MGPEVKVLLLTLSSALPYFPRALYTSFKSSLIASKDCLTGFCSFASVIDAAPGSDAKISPFSKVIPNLPVQDAP